MLKAGPVTFSVLRTGKVYINHQRGVGNYNEVVQSGVKKTVSKVVRRVDLTDDLFKLWITKPPEFKFKPGQYCTIGHQNIERPYSIVSAPSEEDMELLIEVVPPPDGVLTPLLEDVGVGNELSLRPRAKGIFRFKDSAPNHLLVATVTGIAPYISFLRHLKSTDEINKYGIDLLYGASYRDELGYHEEMEKLAEKCRRLSYTPTLSREDALRSGDWSGARGRVHTLIEEHIAKRGLTPADTVIYACGNPGMIDFVRDFSGRGGWNFEEEQFWKEDASGE